jgi:uncharacterized protein DUF6932
MIPDIDPTTGNLPPGVHEGTWSEIVGAFGSTPWRQHLLSGLRACLEALKAAGCTRAYVDGSFVTAKEEPGDFDGCWELAGVDLDRLDEVLLDFTDRRAAQKAKYHGEMFVAHLPASPAGTQFLDFFQHDKHTGQRKGIVTIDLRALS